MSRQGGEPMAELAERLALQELVARYNWALDTCDGAGVAALFVEDGVFDGSKRTWRGREEIASMVVGAREDDGELRTQHWTTNVVARRSGDRCRMVSMSMAPGMAGSTFRMSFLAYYVDDCVKVGGQWLFERRRFRIWDGEGVLAAEFLHEES